MSLDPAALTPGVLDGAAERAFSHGACAAMAIAVHDRTGWPLVKVTDADSVYRRDAEGVLGEALLDGDEYERADSARNVAGMGAGGLHWLVAHPSGKLLDVDGLHEAEDVLERYNDDADDGMAAIGVTDREDAVDEYVEAKGEPIPLALAGEFVDAVLRRAGL